MVRHRYGMAEKTPWCLCDRDAAFLYGSLSAVPSLVRGHSGLWTSQPYISRLQYQKYTSPLLSPAEESRTAPCEKLCAEPSSWTQRCELSLVPSRWCEPLASRIKIRNAVEQRRQRKSRRSQKYTVYHQPAGQRLAPRCFVSARHHWSTYADYTTALAQEMPPNTSSLPAG